MPGNSILIPTRCISVLFRAHSGLHAAVFLISVLLALVFLLHNLAAQSSTKSPDHSHDLQLFG